YAKYLKFKPSDEEAYHKYARLLFAQVAARPEPADGDKRPGQPTNDSLTELAGAPDRANVEKTLAGVEGFLRAFPGHTAERRELAGLYARHGRWASAKQHTEMLFATPGGAFKADVEALELAAECEQGLGDLGKAVALLNEAIKTGRAPVRTYKKSLELNFANVADPQRNANITACLEALLRDPRFVNDVSARIAAAQFQRFLGEPRNARENVTYALEKIPGGADHPDALLAAAELEVYEIKTLDQAPAQLAKARAYLDKAHERAPANVAIGSLLAEVLTRQGHREEGLDKLRAVAKRLPKIDSEFALVLDRLLDLGDEEAAPALIEKFTAGGERRLLGTYFRGRLALNKKDYGAALKLLDEAGPNVAGVRLFHKKAMVGVATCYAVVQNPDKQLEYCNKALTDDPRYALAVLGKGEALAKLGRVPEALAEYRQVVNEYQLLDYRPELVRLELLDVLVRPDTGLRDWTRFEESLGPPEQRAAEVHILNADALVARGRGAEGVALLRGWLGANKGHPKAPAVFVAIARLNEGGTAESALAVLDEAEKTVGRTADVRIARGALLVARARVPTPAEFDALAEGSETFPAVERFRIHLGLGQAAGRVADLQSDPATVRGLREASLKHLGEAARLLPTDLTCRAAMLDQALAAGQADAVDRALKEIAAVEGPDGPVGTLGKVAIRLPEVRKMTDQGTRAVAVKELRALVQRVTASRPGWGRAFVALAELDLIEGHKDAALESYNEAVKKGERQEFVIRRLTDLYREKGQDDAATGLLNKLATEIRLPDDLERYRAIRELLNAAELPKNSRQTIDRNAPADSKDYRLQLLRGALLSTIGDEEASLKAFLEAVAVPGFKDRDGNEIPAGESVPEVWASLVAQLQKLGKKDDARRAVAEAGQKLARGRRDTPEAR
ncbi:MAG: hypothetical protein K2V38_20680, partial [Gemmataceae bacterium]|nr:hypothetical protein [Gemmataceae bacterium]